jgi:hypothetical protein
MSPAIPLPRVLIPGVPPTDGCLLQIAKAFEGSRQVQLGTSYACDDLKTIRGNAKITIKLYDGRQCDESERLVPGGSTLTAKGNIIIRTDALAHFSGRFTIQNPAGVTLFAGYMETIDRICTHVAVPPRISCRPKGHLEGWLVGKGGRGLEDYTLRVLIAAKARALPEVTQSPVTGFLNGVLVRSSEE